MAKKKVKKQDWEIIDTPYGQWEYPGAITRIPSNDITMQGVPYPVLGISDTNDIQMMYPNQDYQFDGSSVTEYPMMQAGGRAPLPTITLDRIEPSYIAPLSAINPKTGKTYRTGDGSGRDYCHSCVEEIKELPDEFKKGSKWGVFESEYNLITGKSKIPYNFEKLQSTPPDWYSRPLKNSERPISKEDIGKRDYFDKKTHEFLGTYDDGGELPEAGSGYKVVRSSERKGKTHKVTGPDGTVKFFGDSKLGQHPKDPARKKAFYARHKKNLAGNPYFRAFARKTWAEGGELNDWEILEDDLPVAKLGTNLEDNKAAYKTVQSKINEGFAKERKYREDVLKYANSVKDDKAFGQRVHDFIANKCRGASSRINDCIGEATTYLKDAGYLDKVYHDNSDFSDDVRDGKVKNFKLVAGNSTNANTVKPGDVVQTTHSIQDPNNPERRFSGQPKHAMFVNKAQPDSTGNLSEFSYIGNWGDASVSHGEHDRTSMMNSFGAGDFQIIKPNFVDQSLVRTRDSLTKEIQKEEPLFNKSRKLIRYNDMRPVKLTPANPGSYSALQLAQLKDTQKMYQPVIDNQAELMKKYNLTQKEFVGLLDNMIGVGEAESQQGSLMSPRYLAKQIPGAQFIGKLFTGDGKKAFDSGEYSEGPWQTKGKYVPKTSYERGSALEAFATMADRYKNEVSNTLKGTDAGFNEAVNKYKGLKDTQNEYLKRVRDVDTFNIEVDGQTQELPKYIGRKQPIRNQPQQIMPDFRDGGYLPKAQNGKRLSFEEYYKTIPSFKNDTSNYDLRHGYDIIPQEQLDAFAKDSFAHLYSAYPNKKTGNWDFLKSKDHHTLQHELDWYNSNTPESNDFRNKYNLDKSGEYYKYTPKKPYTQKAPLPGQSVPTMDFAQGGKIKVKSQDWEILDTAQDGRNLLGTLSNFIPYYETYVDVKDAVVGGFTGDKARMNQGILGLGAPFAGKALTSGLDYITEKGLGKNVADYNEAKRNDITNMSQRDRQKLFEKYGAGGYDKWVKAGKPKLQNGGEMQFYQNGLDWTPRNISKNGSEIPKAQDGRSLTSSELASRFRPEDAYQRSPIKFENIGNKSYGFGIRPNNFNISGVLDLQNKENPTFRTALGYNKNGLNINIAPSFSKDKKEAIFTAGYDGRDWSGNLMYQDPSKFNLGFGYNKAGFSGNANYERQGKNNVFNTSIGYEGEDVPINAGLDYTYDNGHSASANLGFNAKNIRGGFNYDYDQSEKANRFGLNLGTNFGKNKKWAFDTSANFDTDKNYKINTGLKYNFKSGGMLPDLNSMAFGGNLILEKYQEGGQKDIYKRPILSKIEEDPNINRSYYDPKLDIIYAGADYAKMTPEQKNKLLAHENYHAYQFKNDKATYLPVKDIPFAKPSMVSTPEIWNSYYNRKPIEVETDIYDFKSVNPSFQFVPEHLIFDKVVDPGQYENPYTMEGEADFYENTGKDFMKNGGSVWEILPKAGGGKAINNPKIPKVVNVFAEAPIEGESRYDLFNRISSDEIPAMPKELQELFSKFSEADKAVEDARNNPELIKVREPWMKAQADFSQFAENIAIKDKKLPSNNLYDALLYNNYYDGETGEKLDETSINYLNTLYNDNKEYIDNLREQKNKYWKTSNSIYKPLKDTREDIMNSFYAHPLNIKDEKPSPTFTTEANDLKKWYATHYPNTKVNVYSGYGEDFKKTIEDVLATGDENTDIAIMGHSGGRYAGLNNEYFPRQGVADEPSSWNWSDAINKSKYQNCYLGTCYGQDVYNNEGFKDVRNLYSTVDSPWLGVSPTAPSLLNAFFGTQQGKKGDFVGTAIQGQQYDKYSAEPKLQNSPMPDKAKISYEKFGGKIKPKSSNWEIVSDNEWEII